MSVNVAYGFATPQIISRHCIVKEGWYIDHCPQYRQVVRDINRAFSSVFRQIETSVSTIDGIRQRIEPLAQKIAEKRRQMILTQGDSRDPQVDFAMGYMAYLVDLYLRELGQTINFSTTSLELFKKNYYIHDQSGLHIVSVSLFNAPRVTVGATQIPLSFELRNYSMQTIDKIQDVYCFATIGNEDIMIPLWMNNISVAPNSITTIVASLSGEKNTLLTAMPWTKQIHCMIVYQGQSTVLSDFVTGKIRVDE